MSNSSAPALPATSAHLATSPILLKKILVAVDFSEQSTKGLEEAIAIARRFESELLLVHGVSPVVYEAGMEPVTIPPTDLQTEIAKSQMTELLATEPALKELKHREFVEYSNATQVVKRVAQQNAVDLVVAGSHSASGLERVVLGSVAESFLHVVACPVLIVGPHCPKESSPFRSILFATDLETSGLRGAQFASSFAERFHSQLTLLHVIEEKSSRFNRQPELAEDHAGMELARLLPDDISAPTSIRVEYGKADEVVTRVAHSLNASLIVAGFNERSSLRDHAPWSTLSHIIRDAKCPVLCVRGHLV